MRTDPKLLRSMVPTVFLPVGLYEVGNGAIMPVVALMTLNLGASVGVAALIAALPGIGQVVGNVPAAWISTRIGDRWSMLLAAIVMIASSVVCALQPPLLLMSGALLLVGMANAAFYLARQVHLTDAAPPESRGRAMSMLSGSHRIGVLVGPFVGAAVIALVGTKGAFIVAAGAAASAALVLAVPTRETRSRREESNGPEPSTLRRPATSVFRKYKSLFLSLGLTVLFARAVQSSRTALIPLWADHVGIDPGLTSILFGIGGVVEAALFYPAGKIMDRFGRLSAGLPAILLVAGAFLLLPLTRNSVELAAVVVLAGVGQGLGSGLFFTLAADAAPKLGRSTFLAVWRLFSDSGTASGPVLVAALVAGSAVAPAAVVIGCIGVAVAVTERWCFPRYSKFATPAAVRASRN